MNRAATPALVLALGLGLPSLAACDGEGHHDSMRARPGRAPLAGASNSSGPSASTLLAKAKKVLGTPPAVAKPRYAMSDAKIELGRKLYYDTRLSKNHDISCNTCHLLDNYGVDGLPTSKGHKGQIGDRNAPTVYNAAFHLAQFWDGREPDVEHQAKGPPTNPVEMAMGSPERVEATLASIPGYKADFEAVFPDSGVTYDNMAEAIGAFERKLVTPAPFDDFLAGKTEALDAGQLRGLDLFLEAGCTTCHTGAAIGGTSYQKLGVQKPYPCEDEGRKKITGVDADLFVFKVPSLRNVTKTAPYLHDGSVKSIEEMVQIMAKHQTTYGEMKDDEVKAVVAFLDSLTGEIPAEYVAKPKLPESGPDTPAPDPT